MTTSEASYFSPAQVKLYAHTTDGAIWLDDVIGVDYQIEDARTPHFGFSDYEFRTFSSGRTIVSGNLYVAFRHPNYLSSVMTIAGHQEDSVAPASNTSTYTLPLAQAPTPDTIETLRELMKTNLPLYLKMAQDMKEFYYDKGGRAGTDKHKNALERAAEVQRRNRKLLDIRVVFGNDNTGTFTKEIQGVVLTSEREQISMVDGNGDYNIIDVYGFFARNVREVA